MTLLAVAPFDIAMVVGLARTGQSGGTESFYTGIIGRGLAPAVVHLAHGRASTALGSIGLHLGMTAAGLAAPATASASPCGGRTALPAPPAATTSSAPSPTAPVPGAVAGSMSATVLDVVFFSYRQEAELDRLGAPSRAHADRLGCGAPLRRAPAGGGASQTAAAPI